MLNYLTQSLFCYLYIYFIDIFSGIENNSARWFFLHIWINLVVVLFGLYDVFLCLSNPLMCFDNITLWNSSVPFMMGFTGHMYHLIMFDKIKPSDIFHHVLMWSIAGTLSFLYLQKPGTNLALFGLTGFPGAIDYILLYFVKSGIIRSIQEKKCNIFIQTWIRMPIILITGGILYVNLLHHQIQSYLYLLCASITGLLCVWNGIHYMHDTLESYYSKAI